MLSPRLGFLFACFVLGAACGGKIDDGTDSGVDSGTDSPSPPPTCKPPGSACTSTSDCCYSSCIGGVCATMPPTCVPDYGKCSTSAQCCSQLCNPQTGYCEPNTPPPPPCEPDGTPCGTSSQCCSLVCNAGTCGTPPPPPPPCKPGGYTCVSGAECCSMGCDAGLCDSPPPFVDAGPIACGSTSNKLCDQCVANTCCPQMVSCGNDAPCNQWLSCVQTCEQKGYSAFWCTQNACGAPSDSAESALYTCAQQYCATQCTKD